MNVIKGVCPHFMNVKSALSSRFMNEPALERAAIDLLAESPRDCRGEVIADLRLGGNRRDDRVFVHFRFLYWFLVSP